jgi:hypothetical protein
VEEYLVCNIKVGGSHPACAQVFLQNIARKFPVALKTQQKFQAQMA